MSKRNSYEIASDGYYIRSSVQCHNNSAHIIHIIKDNLI